MIRRTLVVMVKEPRPGRVKTRLGREIGMTRAAWWFRHQTRSLLRRMRDPRWQIVLAVSPDAEGLRSPVWPRDLARLPQGNGHLGRRMMRQMRATPGPVCVIGADIPGVTPRAVWHAFQTLGDHDAVFGPATDGGYWLVGLKHPSRSLLALLDPVRWSTEHALTDSVAAMGAMRIGMVETLSDVDTAKDLDRR